MQSMGSELAVCSLFLLKTWAIIISILPQWQPMGLC